MEEKEVEQTTETDEAVESEQETVTDEQTDESKNGEEKESPEEKLYNQSEINEMVEKRLAKQKKKLEREYSEKTSKLNELAYLNQMGLKANSLDETLEKSRNFYSKQGIVYKPSDEETTRDQEVLAKADAQELIESCDSDEDLELEAKKLSNKANLNGRERIKLQFLQEELNARKSYSSLKKIGVTDEEINSEDFRKFAKKFDKSADATEIWELYRLKNEPQKNVKNPGSLYSNTEKVEKPYYTEAEIQKLTSEQLDDPDVWAKVQRSLTSKK